MAFNRAKFSIVAGLSLTVALAATPALAEELQAAGVDGSTTTETTVETQAEPEVAAVTQASDEGAVATTAQAVTVVSQVENSEPVAVSSPEAEGSAVATDAGSIANNATDSQDAATGSSAGETAGSGDAANAVSADAALEPGVSSLQAGSDAILVSGGDDTLEAQATSTSKDDETAAEDEDTTSEDEDASATNTLTGWQGSDETGWRYYLADGSYATGEQELSDSSDASQLHWYYFDDTTGYRIYGWKWIATDDSLGKWVYYEGTPQTGGLGWRLAGEAYVRQDNNEGSPYGWYYFDDATGAATYGWKYLESGNKWVYYDGTPQEGGTGVMKHGEAYVRRDNNEGSDSGWYYFDDNTGATTYGWKYLESGNKWVNYDSVGGYMHHGEAYLYSGSDEASIAQGQHWYYFDDITGATTYGWKNLSDGRTVYYIPISGWMAHGYYNVTDVDTYAIDTTTDRIKAVDSAHDRSVTYYFDENTGNWTVGSQAAWSAYTRIRAAGSSSGYIICVDITNHRTIIFEGSAGNWKPIFDWSCGTGVKGTQEIFPAGSPTGLFVLGNEDTTGYNGHNDPTGRHFEEGDHWWFTSIWYSVGFHTTLDNGVPEDQQLGRDVSMACVRLHYGNAKWLYKHCGVGTPVYMYT